MTASPAQRPSWNYRAEDGGGIVLDMFPHWTYLLEELFGPVRAVYARRVTHLPRRWDEAGEPYEVTADDAAYAVLEFDGGAVGSVNSSWAVRVNRRELLEVQVDGTHGSAVAGLRNCAVQHRVSTPMPVWNPDLPDPLDYQAMWTDVPDNMAIDNGFKAQWELFLRSAARGEPFRWDLFAGARGVQLAELAMRSSDEGRRIEIPRGERSTRARRRSVTAAIVLPGRAEPLEIAAPGWAHGLPAARVAARLRGRARRLRRTAAISSTGRRRCGSATTCGSTASRSPRRWTPRSAAWACPGGWRVS